MAVKVVDASALAAILFNEPEAEQIVDKLADARLVAPELLWFEIANVCLVKCRRHPDQTERLRAAFADRVEMQIEELSTDHDECLALAARTGLTAYDASYLWMAVRLGAELVTLDRKLATAAARLP